MVLHLPELTCRQCAAALEHTLAAFDGVDHVRVDLARRAVTVWCEPGPELRTRIVAAINEEGYVAVAPEP